MGYADTKSWTTKIVAANTDTQILIAPWRAQRRYFVNKIIITNEGAAAIVKLYDDDLSNATPPVRGNSGSAPLLEFYVPTNTSLLVDERQCPKEFFISGIVGNSTIANVVVTIEYKED
jgi:hypothetical protein